MGTVAKRRIRPPSPWLGPIDRDESDRPKLPKPHRFAVLDIESKAGDTQAAGFTRPFLAGFYDPFTESLGSTKKGTYLEFRNEPHLASRPWEDRHIMPGGCIDKLLSAILVPELSGCIFYAHNGGGFDYLFFLKWLREHRDEFETETIPVQSSIQVIRVWRKPMKEGDPVVERWDFLDSMKLLPFGLDKACKTFKVPTKIQHDLNLHEEHPHWSEYLEQDCRALAAVMDRLVMLVQDRLGGEMGITTPSTSVKLFRKRFIGRDGVPAKIQRHLHWPDCRGRGTRTAPGTCTGCMHEWVRRGYYGGRTEIHRLYGQGLRYYDINSSYVAAMRMNDMPIGERKIDKGSLHWPRHRRAKRIGELPANPKGAYSGFCECTVWIPPECPIPPLPYKDVTTGKLLFPTGQMHGVWSVEELALLSDPMVRGEIRHVTQTVWFRLEPMFQNMMAELWKLRNPDLPGYDGGLSALAKLLGNGGYGKFAMKQERTSIVFRREAVTKAGCPGECILCGEAVATPEEQLCKNCEGSKCAEPGERGDVYYKANKVDAPYIIPHVAAHVTALARVCLWKWMRHALVTKAPKRTPLMNLWVGDVVRGAFASGPVPFLGSRLAADESESAWMVEEISHGDSRSLKLRSLTDSATCTIDVAKAEAEALAQIPLEMQEAPGFSLSVGYEGKAMRVLRPGDICFFAQEGARGWFVESVSADGTVLMARALTDAEGESMATLEQIRVEIQPDYTVEVGGSLYYCDTDSVITNATLPTSNQIGDMKDEHPGAELEYEAVQPKVYFIANKRHNQKRARHNVRAEETWIRTHAGLAGGDAIGRVEPHFYESHDDHVKVTMKGFPSRERTQANLKRLQKGEMLAWSQLAKVRTLAREGFKKSPFMRQDETAVKKSFKSPYDKRQLYPDPKAPDGSGRTVAVVLCDPIGGVAENDWDISEAAE